MKRTDKKTTATRNSGKKGQLEAVKAEKGQKKVEKSKVLAKAPSKTRAISGPVKAKVGSVKSGSASKKSSVVENKSKTVKKTASVSVAASKSVHKNIKPVASKAKKVPAKTQTTDPKVKSSASAAKPPVSKSIPKKSVSGVGKTKKTPVTPPVKTAKETKSLQKQVIKKGSDSASEKIVKSKQVTGKVKASVAPKPKSSTQTIKDIKSTSSASNKKPKASQATSNDKKQKAQDVKPKASAKSVANVKTAKAASNVKPKVSPKAGSQVAIDSNTPKEESKAVNKGQKQVPKEGKSAKASTTAPPKPTPPKLAGKAEVKKTGKKAVVDKKKKSSSSGDNDGIVDIPIVEPTFHIDEDDDDLSMLTAAQKKLRKKELEKRRVAAEKVANKLRAKQKRLDHVFIKPEMDPSILTANRVTKEFLELKYSFDCEPRDLILALTKAEYMRNWLAERVEVDDKTGIYSFYWRNYSESARIVDKVQDRYIKWQWIGIERPANEYLIFSIDIIPGDSYVDLYILDICEPGEREIMTKGWDKLMDRLRVIVT
jgi:hypothetical protein